MAPVPIPKLPILSMSSGSLEATSAIFRSVFVTKTEPCWFSVSSSRNGNNFVLRVSQLKHLWTVKFETQCQWRSAYHCLCVRRLVKSCQAWYKYSTFPWRCEPIRMRGGAIGEARALSSNCSVVRTPASSHARHWKKVGPLPTPWAPQWHFPQPLLVSIYFIHPAYFLSHSQTSEPFSLCSSPPEHELISTFQRIQR